MVLESLRRRLLGVLGIVGIHEIVIRRVHVVKQVLKFDFILGFLLDLNTIIGLGSRWRRRFGCRRSALRNTLRFGNFNHHGVLIRRRTAPRRSRAVFVHWDRRGDIAVGLGAGRVGVRHVVVTKGEL
jgi:hypothetical protein